MKRNQGEREAIVAVAVCALILAAGAYGAKAETVESAADAKLTKLKIIPNSINWRDVPTHATGPSFIVSLVNSSSGDVPSVVEFDGSSGSSHSYAASSVASSFETSARNARLSSDR